MHFATVVLVVFAAVAASEVSALAPRRACHCPRIYMPVCASNGKTFSNKCEFDCVAKLDASLKIAKQGGCETEEVEEPRIAIDEPKKVEQPRIAIDVPKKVECACPMIYSPVCGSDGTTYSNTCTFKCEVRRRSDVTVAYEGTCNAQDESNLVVD